MYAEPRTYNRKKHSEKRYIEKFISRNTDEPKIKYLDLKLSNECNLACRMCDYTGSNVIYKDVPAIEEQDLHHPSNWGRSPNMTF